MPNVQEFLDAYRDAFRDRDPEAMLELYSEDLRTFDVHEPSEHRDPDSWAVRVHLWLNSFAKEPVCEFREVEILQTPDMAVITAHVTCSDGPGTKGPVAHNEFRATFVLADLNDGWLVVHEHNSVPAAPSDPEDGVDGFRETIAALGFDPTELVD